MTETEFIKKIKILISSKVHSIKSIDIKRKHDLIYARCSLDVTIWYKKTKSSKVSLTSYMLFANDVRTVRSLDDILAKILAELNEI